MTSQPPATAVFYQVRDSVDEGALWAFLRRDEQAWRRNRMDDLLAEVPESTEFIAVEYYFYYVRDVGLKGHPEDIEFAFLFMPRDARLACRLQVMVGAGHESRNPNNILVRTEAQVLGELKAGVIVELGGHASAPDAGNDGAFVMGMDVNWGLQNVWGTRDLLAVAGSGFLGPYEPGLTLPRTNAALNVDRAQGSSRNGYVLVPVWALENLENALKRARSAEDVSAEFDALARLVGVADPPVIDDEALPLLRAWAEDLEGGDKGHRFWQHHHYTDPADFILKRHVYRPAFGWVPAVGMGTDQGVHAMLGLRVAMPSVAHLHFPGIVELLWRPATDRTHLALTYEASYAEYLTWHLTLEWDDRWRGLSKNPGVPVAPRERGWRLGGGPSAIACLADHRAWCNLWGLGQAVRVRTGPFIDVRQLAKGLDRVGWSLSVALR